MPKYPKRNPYIIFLFIAEHGRKYTDFLASGIRLQHSIDNIERYKIDKETRRDVKISNTELYNIWFTHIMKGDNKENRTVIIRHDEKDPKSLIEVFDARMHEQFTKLDHTLISIDLRSDKCTCTEADNLLFDYVFKEIFKRLDNVLLFGLFKNLKCIHIWKLDKSGFHLKAIK